MNLPGDGVDCLIDDLLEVLDAHPKDEQEERARYWATLSLGALSPEAKRAIPRLRRLLEEPPPMKEFALHALRRLLLPPTSRMDSPE